MKLGDIMTKKEQPYNIGLDIGTGSVGWAVTNDNYDLLNIKKKNLWGVRLFEGAQTAKETRLNRSTRRRYRRRKNRINWLNEIFSEELANTDPSFLIRLQNSWVSKKDPDRKRDKYNLFIDNPYTDKEYYREFPTIFHLRKELIINKNKADIRLVYLALHNILKYRGNFTYEHQKFNISTLNSNLSKELIELNQQLIKYDISFPDNCDWNHISDILIGRGNATQKSSNILNNFTLDKETKKLLKEVINLILGNVAHLNTIFKTSLTKDEEKLSFSGKDIESKLDDLDSILDDDQFTVLDTANRIYSTITLNEILNGESYFSMAKVNQYENHAIDLCKLRDMWHTTKNEKAVGLSRQAYDDYINKPKYGTKELYTSLKKFLKVALPTNLAKEAEEKISKGTYLVKPRNSENGVVPYQLNKIEMEKIIDNQSQYYPFLKENKEKLLSILSFRISYYVGPLQSSEKNPFAWMERKSNGHARPWNFDEIVDREKSSNKFIRRMTVTDSYLVGEPVLPKNSLIYQRYEVLNELNNIRITENLKTNPTGSRLTVETKQRIYNELFKNYKKITVKKLTKWLIAQGYYKNPILIGLSQKDEFNSTLTTYLDMKKIFGSSFMENNKNYNQIEELIEWLTIFEDKQILNEKLHSSNYSYTSDQIKKISNMRYKGWGRLSKKILTCITTETNTPKSLQLSNYSVLDLMWTTNNNFISIISNDKYDFKNYIENHNLNKNEDQNISNLVNDIHVSPALKRGITQSIKIVQEIVKFMGHAPKYIFIEVTRETKKSEITTSRGKRIQRLQSKLLNKANGFKPQLRKYLVPNEKIQEELKKHKNDLSSERIMLYFLQNGKSLYSEESLNINKLSDYQVDHILPRTYIPDDSLENKALVLAKENQRKADDLLLNSNVIDKNLERWTYMLNNNMMGLKKFKNLTRRVITDKDKLGFIHRQLVQTSQMVKGVANILNSMYKNQGTTCIQARANLSTAFRKALSDQDDRYHFKHPELVKNRNINDFHHAQDAYLASFLGTYRLRRFPTDEMLLMNGEYNKFYGQVKELYSKKKKLPDSRKNGFIISPLVNGTTQYDRNTGEIIWNVGFRDKILKIFNYHQCNVTRKTEIKTGQFYDQTIYSPKNPKYKKLIAQKKDMDPNIYGGFSGDNKSSITIVKIDNNKIKPVAIPIRLINDLKDKKTLQNWLEENVKHKKSIQIIKNNVPIGQIIYSKKVGLLSLNSDREIANRQQLILPPEHSALLRILQIPDEDPDQILAFYDKNILVEILQELITKMKKFYPFYKNEQEFLASNIENFNQATTSEKINSLEELITLLHANSTSAHLIFNNIEKKAFGRKTHGLTLNDTDFIYQSVTGLYETRIHIE